MKKTKIIALAAAVLAGSEAWAGGLLTNTNQNIAFNRNFAREGTIGIDGVYSNPAGVAFLGKGLHMSFNIQNVYQTRVINSGITIPSLNGTPFYQSFKMNGGDENGVKRFKGKASVPILPSVQAAYNYDKWGFQFGFALIGGGGKCTFNNGLGSFERQISMIPALLYQYSQDATMATALGIDASKPNMPGYGVSSYINGQQYVFGTQLGVTYKVNEHLSLYAGARFNYIYNTYEGNIVGISANINGNSENVYNYLSGRVNSLNTMAAAYKAQAGTVTDPATKAQLEGAAKMLEQGAEKLNTAKEQFADKYLDCTQRGWGITPIIGIDYKTGKWNFGARLEFTNHLNIENDTKRDDTGLFADGVNTPNDLPGIFAAGGQYSVLPNVRVMASYHYYFDKNAKMANDKQKLLSGNTQEYLAGAEWDITKDLTISAGGQRTQYRLGKGGYLSDMSFVTSSYSVGFGAKFKVAKNASVNVAYFWTDYQHFNKESEAEIRGIAVKNTDDFTRTNKVFGVGLDIDL
jgi:hypothetical protein